MMLRTLALAACLLAGSMVAQAAQPVNLQTQAYAASPRLSSQAVLVLDSQTGKPVY
jgi:D-alanyl-D-alanine carboxypeptidase